MSEQIILVDESDKPLGPIEKMAAHVRPGRLHRAFSIFIFNSRGEMLVQLRASKKYHFGGLWTNACCSHPRWGEELGAAAKRRLLEECGFEAELVEVFSFIYQADWNERVSEHELDHVFVGKYDGKLPVNPDEAEDWKWVDCHQLMADVNKRPESYTPWFKIAIERGVLAYCR